MRWILPLIGSPSRRGNRMKRIVMITLTLCSLLFAAQDDDVALSGTVKGVDGKALDGVKVALANLKDLSSVTKADGAFILSNATNVLLPSDLTTSYGITFSNNAIVFDNGSDKVTGSVGLYSMNGRLITSVSLDNHPNAQQHLTLTNLSAGTYLLAGIVNGKSFTRSLVCMANNQLRGQENLKSNAAGTNREGTLRKASSFAAIVDTLIFSKEGYTTQRWPVSSLSKEKIRIVLRKPDEKPVVFFTKELGPKGFTAIYEAIGYDLPGEIMVKVHNGEKDGKYFISSNRMADLVNQVNGTIVETCLQFSMNGFFRDKPDRNLQISKDHGFDTIGKGVDIIDTKGEITLTVVGGSQLGGKCYVGANFKNYQSSLVISHFKGHGISGFGGALKNVGIGFSSPEGKGLIHSGGTKKGLGTGIWTRDNGLFQKGMVEASKAVHDALGGNLVYINTVDNLTLECDCDVALGQKAPEMPDIGMLGSLDPVAIDKASYDLVMAADGGQALKTRISGSTYKGLDGLKYGKTIGLGNTEYILVDIDM